MKLPKIKYPIFEITIPSTNKKINYRQMLVQDEKILLTAKAGGDRRDIIRAIKQVVNNCIIDDIDVDTLATFDIEYLFLKFRAISIGNVIEVIYTDVDAEKQYKFIINLDDVSMRWPDEEEKIVKINETYAIQLKYPPATLFDDDISKINGDDGYEYLASQCIDKIIDGDEVFDSSECSDEELLEFIQSMDSKSYNKVKEFINNMPRLSYTVEYVDSQEVSRKLELNTLTDFFTFW